MSAKTAEVDWDQQIQKERERWGGGEERQNLVVESTRCVVPYSLCSLTVAE